MAEEELVQRLEESTRDAHRLQLDTLRAILDRNARVGYLEPHLHGFDGPIDADSYRRVVPISSYEDYAPHIHHIADGHDPSVLSFDPLLCFFYSSGTSSMKPKMIPYFDCKPAKTSSTLAHQASSAILRRLFPPRPTINKILWFLYAGDVTETKGGIRVMAASAFPLQHKAPNPSPLLSLCVSPPQVLLGSDTRHQMYCHLLCGLRNSYLIDGIRAPYAVGLVRAFRLLESNWEQLCDDLERGSVNLEITDPAMRGAVGELLNGPQPVMANRIREICRKQNWAGIIHELWPDVRYIACVTTGSMGQYFPILKNYAGESIPILGGDYFASECAVGINMERMLPPDQTRYVILPTAAYFEFLPFEMGSSNLTETVDISGVEIEKLYEVVVTTYRGLYRYRLGDVVKVIGFYNSSPQVEFVTRAPKETTEVYTERDLLTAMESFQLMLTDEETGGVAEFAGFMDLESAPKHVIVFVEASKRWESLLEEKSQEFHVLLKMCHLFMEDGLGSVYKVKRVSGDIGPLEIAVVKQGTFDELQMVALDHGAPANQYKPPKIIRNHDMAGFLKASIVLTVS